MRNQKLKNSKFKKLKTISLTRAVSCVPAGVRWEEAKGGVSARALNMEVLITRRPAAQAPRCGGNVGEVMRFM